MSVRFSVLLILASVIGVIAVGGWLQVDYWKTHCSNIGREAHVSYDGWSCR
jgi:hypothetical protein